MRSIKQSGTLVAFVALLVSLAAGVAVAQDSIRVNTIAAGAGDRVVMPIDADTSQDLTLLSLDIVFDVSLCEHIENSLIETAGRTRGAVQEGGLKCPEEGRLRIVLLDLSGMAVIPAGSGEIVNWTFDLKASAPSGLFPLGINLAQASNGPAAVSLVVQGGGLMVGGACVGDCDGSGQVSIDELVRGVEIGLGKQDLDDCPAMDGTGDGFVSVADLVAGVNSGLRGCSVDR